ncbi:MAG: hypothetical protein J5379_02825 [Clostridiales bacterium]|nr:hypothetical protein [Clostridiales bacterium]
MRQNGLVKILAVVISFVGVFTLFFVGSYYIKKQSSTAKENQSNIESTRQADLQRQTKVNDETGKIILTDEYIKTDYEAYYNNLSEGLKVFGTFKTLFIVVVIAFSLIACVTYVFKTLHNAKTPNPIIILASLLPIPVMLFAINFIFSGVNVSAPKPEEAVIKTYQVVVLDKKSTSYTDSEGSSYEDYYLISDDNGQNRSVPVTEKMYNSVSGSGLYYISGTEANKTLRFFAIYSTDRYEYSKGEIENYDGK